MRPIPSDLSSWNAIVEIVASLRAKEGGCPWDLEQTHRSLVPFAIEETHELAEAIESEGANTPEGDALITEELGDVLLQVLLHAQIASEEGRFNWRDVVRTLSEKMVRRHPHVFGDQKASSSAEVLSQWQEIKNKEKGSDKNPVKAAREKLRSIFNVPLHLPALQRASKIGEKTARLKFDWPDWKGVLAKVDEELAEVKEALAQAPDKPAKPKDEKETGPSYDPVAAEIGDLLFSTAQLARHRGYDPEQCLREANARFERRFNEMREIEADLGKRDGKNWDARSLEELESYWVEAKKRTQ